jgi:hypothetical protein
MQKVVEAFSSIIGRSESVRAAGCEEWKGGIRVYNARRMASPFDRFVGFRLTQEGMNDYFTMPSELSESR